MYSFDNIQDRYETNRIQILNDKNFKQLIDEIKNTKEFVYNLDFLNFNRSYNFFGGSAIISINNILDSAML